MGYLVQSAAATETGKVNGWINGWMRRASVNSDSGTK